MARGERRRRQVSPWRGGREGEDRSAPGVGGEKEKTGLPLAWGERRRSQVSPGVGGEKEKTGVLVGSTFVIVVSLATYNLASPPSPHPLDGPSESITTVRNSNVEAPCWPCSL